MTTDAMFDAYCDESWLEETVIKFDWRRFSPEWARTHTILLDPETKHIVLLCYATWQQLRKVPAIARVLEPMVGDLMKANPEMTLKEAMVKLGKWTADEEYALRFTPTRRHMGGCAHGRPA